MIKHSKKQKGGGGRVGREVGPKGSFGSELNELVADLVAVVDQSLKNYISF